MFGPKDINHDTQENKTFRYFTVMYGTALLLIAVFSIISQVLIQNYLSNQVADSRLLNFSARLRTYSQSLSKTALLLERGSDFDNNRKEFITTLKQWQKSHRGLLSGNDFLDLPKNDREDLEQMYGIIEGPFTKIVTASNSLIDELYSNKPMDSLVISPYVTTILDYEKSYLLGMELIVFDYDRFSRNSVKRLKTIEYYILGFIMFMLFLEVLFIFYPLSRRIKRIIHGMEESQTEYKNIANELSDAYETMENSHRELREINFALEKANYLVKTDADGKIIYANDKYAHVAKYEPSELNSKPLFYNNHGGKESIIYEHIRDEQRRKEVWQGEIYDHASDGTGFWLDVTLMPVINSKGVLYQYMVIGTDITKRKNTEKKLRTLMQEQLTHQRDEQKIKSYSMVIGQEKERKRVAAEIHDGIGQMLTSLRMRLEMVIGKHPDSIGDLNKVHDLLKSIVDETRRICSDLLPNVLDDFGLKAAVHDLVKNIECEKLKFTIEDRIQTKFLKKEIQISVFRIIQEALNNVMKHAEASNVHIYIDNNESYINLIIEDNGKGFIFDEKKLFVKELAEKNNGLRNMKERAELLGGVLNIMSEPERGTTIQLEIPL